MFPIILLIIAVGFINILTWYRNKCAILSSLGSLTFTLCAFLVLITVFYEIYKYINKRESTVIIEEKTKNPQETKKTEINVQQDGLLEIKKVNVSQQSQESVSLERRIYSYFYIISFLGIAFWRVIGIFKLMHSPYVGNYTAVS